MMEQIRKIWQLLQSDSQFCTGRPICISYQFVKYTWVWITVRGQGMYNSYINTIRPDACAHVPEVHMHVTHMTCLLH